MYITGSAEVVAPRRNCASPRPRRLGWSNSLLCSYYVTCIHLYMLYICVYIYAYIIIYMYVYICI